MRDATHAQVHGVAEDHDAWGRARGAAAGATAVGRGERRRWWEEAAPAARCRLACLGADALRLWAGRRAGSQRGAAAVAAAASEAAAPERRGRRHTCVPPSRRPASTHDPSLTWPRSFTHVLARGAAAAGPQATLQSAHCVGPGRRAPRTASPCLAAAALSKLGAHASARCTARLSWPGWCVSGSGRGKASRARGSSL